MEVLTALAGFASNPTRPRKGSALVPQQTLAHDGTAEEPPQPARAAYWTDALAEYARPSLRRSISCLLSSVVPYLALLVAMYFALRVSVLLTLGLGVVAAGFLLRTYIVFHDCAHGSFLPSKRASHWRSTRPP